MTIKLTGNTLGGIIEANGTPVANVTSAQGFPFCKNKLFNGEVTRINQRGFDGNWATKNIWAGGNTIAQQELCYGYDMWAKASATDMVQPIEAGNFRPSTVHTISGDNMTTRQETSPASGNWNIVVPQAARNVQVEEGSVATPFEMRPIGFELAQCQRYYEATYDGVPAGTSTGNGALVATIVAQNTGQPQVTIRYSVQKRVIPSTKYYRPDGTVDAWDYTAQSGLGGPIAASSGSPSKSQVVVVCATVANWEPVYLAGHWVASAVI